MFPENLVQACFQSTTTYYVSKTPELDADNATAALTTLSPLMTTSINTSNLTVVELFERKQKYIDGMNVLGARGRMISRSFSR